MPPTVFRPVGASRPVWVVASLALVGSLCAAMRVSAAGPPVDASGSATTVSFTVTGARSAGPVTVLEFTEHDVLTGTFNGTTVIEGSCVVNPTGTSVCRAVETFTGTVDGVSGTATFHDEVVIDANGMVNGSFTIVSSTGGLTDLHGHGTFTSTAGVGTYTGQIVFAP